MSKLIPRRTFLKGMGTMMALPVLEGMLPLSALASTPKAMPVRMAFLFVPNGVMIPDWTPQAAGPLTDLPYILEPMNELKGSLNVITGLAQKNAFALGDGPGDHARSAAAWLTGVHPRKTSGADIKNGISVDQVGAQKLGHLTPFASLELGCERSAQAGDCDSGYSCAYSSCISWRGEATPVAKEVNPRLVFERLFGNGNSKEVEDSSQYRDQYNRSILDFVLEDANDLKSRLGSHDKRKLDEYLSSVREIEERVSKYEAARQNTTGVGLTAPTGVPQAFDEHIRLMGDMMVLAFQTDLTRISTFMISNEGSNRSYPMIGVPEGHHDMSHHGKDAHKIESKRKIDRFHAEQVAYILKRMAAVKEPNGSLLDNSMVVYGGGISDGDRHNHDDLPILMAGKAGGTIKTGSHLVFDNGTPLNNLFLTMLDRLGVPTETLGDSTGKLQHLF